MIESCIDRNLTSINAYKSVEKSVEKLNRILKIRASLKLQCSLQVEFAAPTHCVERPVTTKRQKTPNGMRAGSSGRSLLRFEYVHVRRVVQCTAADEFMNLVEFGFVFLCVDRL